MRTSLFTAAFLCLNGVFAQCDFDPVITTIDLLCPGGSDQLSVGLYDSYQWFQDGQPVAGGDQPELMVTYASAAGSNFTVEVTLDGCTEMSPPLLVDGYAFLPLVVITDPAPFIDIWTNASFCVGDEPQLSIMPPWTENIVWTLDGVPIPGETGMSYTMTESGTYQVTASSAECLDHFDMSLPLTYEFIEVLQPDIVGSPGSLCAYPPGDSYTWYHNGQLLDENSSCLADYGSGSYTVFVEYNSLCEEIMSEPYLTTNIPTAAPAVPVRVHPDRHAGRIHIFLEQEDRSDITFRIIDVLGRSMNSGSVPPDGMLDLHMAEGTYLLQLFRRTTPLAAPARFVWM